VNLAERVTTLREMPGSQPPEELEAMTVAVRAMVSKSLGALIFRNATMAAQVLESDDLVDQYRDRIFEQLLEQMTKQTAQVVPSMQFILATRHLERIADHATNIAEDIIYWVKGLDVRHGRGLGIPPGTASGAEGTREVTEDSHGLYSDVTGRPDTQHV
jgi:phosphate transport system protein